MTISRLGALGLLAAAPVAATLAAPARAADKITIAQPLTYIGGGAVYASMKFGYFQDEGLDVDLVTISGTAPMFAGVASGSAQFGITNGLSLLTAVAKGIPFVAFVGTDHGFSLLNMVVSAAWAQSHKMSSKDDYRTSIRKLVGARIGLLGTTSTGGLLLAAAAKQMGLRDDAFQMVAMGPSAALAAFSNGQIDAYWQGIPPTGGVYVFNSGALAGIDKVAGNIVFSTADYIDKHPDIVTRVARAVARGTNAVLDPKMQARVLAAISERIPEFSIAAIKGELLRPGVPASNGQLAAEPFVLANQFDAQIGLIEKALTPEQVNGAFTLKFVPKTFIKP
jgi:ABC-type nitrate/sulfonate/bicarbonate transport system substrate-binding protein